MAAAVVLLNKGKAGVFLAIAELDIKPVCLAEKHVVTISVQKYVAHVFSSAGSRKYPILSSSTVPLLHTWLPLAVISAVNNDL